MQGAPYNDRMEPLTDDGREPGLPDDATIDDAQDRLHLLEGIDRGIAQADAGQVVSHADAKARFAHWLT
ncbi:MAG: prevent-host-death family protein [Chloroflexota bacterium]